MNYYARRRHDASIFDVFTLNPLPYPVLLLLIVIFVFLGISWSFSYESVVEDAELNFGLFLKVVPVLLLLLVQLLSKFENPERWFYTSPYDRRRKAHYFQSSDGASPWWVLGLIVLLLLMVSYQSTFLDSWFG
ncbi:hypothetical protein Scep_000383 [Stephania cephalantha]|uniref:Uncharacterized protein n=1 Tax=Stephania cephalantha TaxID=152367 RepID=A0AAP0L5Y2_9MAGN